jgi:protein-L-isoaspartate(D-aspartate) O-methyltransferase
MSQTITYRRFFAEEIAAVANLKTASIVDALGAIPRERYLPPGPWFVRAESDRSGPRLTPDDDARHVYHNYSIAIDPQSQLYNGAPSVVAGALDLAGPRPGEHFLHIGAGLGYYTAVAAHCVGQCGYVLAIEADRGLANMAQSNLADQPWVEVLHGDATAPLGQRFDVIFVSAGVTHPLDTWLDALLPGGRLVAPLTASIPAMGPVSMGFLFLFAKDADHAISATAMTMTAIYSAVAVRDHAIDQQLGAALMRAPFPRVTRLRRDAHAADSHCWLHCDTFCIGS